jgi:hypothetical protein
MGNGDGQPNAVPIPYTGANPPGAPPAGMMQAIMSLLQKNQATQGGGSSQGAPQSGQAQSIPLPQPQVGAATPPIQYAPPSSGGFGATKGVLGLISGMEQKEHSKKVMQAENLMTQMNQLLSPTGDPKQDQQNRAMAQMLADDPKNRKILKAGLEYQFPQEDIPPEAIGVAQAMQKIRKGQQGKPQQPQTRSVLPQPNQMQGLQAILPIAQQLATLGKTQQETQTSGAEAGKFGAEAGKAQAEANLVPSQQEKNEAEARKALADELKSKADADKAKVDAAVAAGKSQAEIDELNARAKASKGLYDRNEAEAGKLRAETNAGGTPQELLAQFRESYTGFKDIADKGISDMKDLQKQDAKFRGDTVMGVQRTRYKDVSKDLDAATDKVKKLAKARQWFNDQQDDVIHGRVKLGDVQKQAYQMAGLDPNGQEMAPVPPNVAKALKGQKEGDYQLDGKDWYHVDASNNITKIAAPQGQ